MRGRLIVLCLIVFCGAAPLAGAAWGAAGPVVQASATPQPAPSFDIGVAPGDGYYPGSVAVDEARQVAYVYNTNSPERRPVISVVRLRDGQPERVIPLDGDGPGGLGRLLVTAEGRLLFVDQEGGTLSQIDPGADRVTLLLSDVRDAVLSPDGGYAYVLTRTALRAYLTADLMGQRRPAWEAAGASDKVAAGGSGVAVVSAAGVGAPSLASYEAATGTLVARATLGEPAAALAAGPAGSWAAVTTGDKPKLRRFDTALRQTHETEIPYAYDISYDAPRERYLLSGFRYDGRVSTSQILGYSASDLQQVAAVDRAGPQVAALFVNWGQDRILGYSRGGPSRLEVLDPQLVEVGRMITGARPVDMVLDETRARLYVADEHDRIHVLELDGGRRSAQWDGGAPLAFDAEHGRLYANLPGKVVALDANGVKVAEFPQEGTAAPDPNRDLVYIVSNGVTMYDRSGKKLGELPSSFPTPGGLIPNVYAVSARVNPVSGYLAVIINNGVPGSNNGTFLRLYPPKTDTPISLPGVYSFVTDVTFDRAGNFYVTYSPAKSMDAVQVLDPRGRELRKLAGRSGQIALDAGTNQLYLVTPGLVTRLAADTLAPAAFLRGPEDLERLAFSPERQTLYVYGGLNPRIKGVPLADLAPVDMRARAGAPPSEAVLEQLYISTTGRNDTLIARYSDGLYRTRDGKRWERLAVGTVSTWRQVAVAPKGVLWWAGTGYDGGDGTWRSTDGGSTWTPMMDGLRDLRLMGESGLAAAGADEAYAVSRTAGLLRWNGAARRWEGLGENRQPSQTPGKLHMAPGGKELFHSAYDLLRTSTDGGRTWQELKAPARSGNLIGFSGFYTGTGTLYGMWGDTALQPMRSTDRGETWQILSTNVDLTRDFYTPEIASVGYDTYLIARRYSGEDSVLLKSDDDGATWQRAPGEAGRGVFHIALGTDGRLWLGGKNSVRAVDPRTIKWAPAAPPRPTATQTARPSVRATAPPTTPSTALPTARPATALPPTALPTLAPCSRALQGAEAEAAGRAPELGCPAGAAAAVPMARQSFQNGQMIWRSDNRTIYVITNKGSWQSYQDTWVEGLPDSDPALVAPAGVEQPVRGFGKVWREKLGGTKAGIGWALGKEQGVSGVVQAWDRGTVFRFGGEMIVLLDGGRVK